MTWEPGGKARYHAERQNLFRQHGVHFRAASGAPRGRWHVIASYTACPKGHPLHGHGSCNLSDAAGRMRTFASYKAAQKAADAFNAGPPQ